MVETTFSPAWQLLAACSFYDEQRWDEQQRRVTAALDADPDLDEFLALVARHRVAALAQHVLARCGRTLPQLARPARQSRLQTLALHAEWLRLGERFTAAGIPVMAFKGTPLSLRLYGDPALRHSKDLDLLTTPEALPAALDLLVREGYQMPAHAEWHLEGYSPTRRTIVELHWHVERLAGSRVNARWMEWLHAGERARSFELLHLCLHGSEHFWTRLKWLGDVRVLFGRMTPGDWPGLLELSRELRMEAILGEALLLVERVYGLCPLGTVRQEGAAEALAAESLACLVSPLSAFDQSRRRRWTRRIVRAARLRDRLSLAEHVTSVVAMFCHRPAGSAERPTSSAQPPKLQEPHLPARQAGVR